MSENLPSSRLFGRRKGRPLRVRKTRLIQELLPTVEIRLDEKAALNPSSLFPFKPKAIWLEIGFGGGEHLAAQAKRHPDIGFIGCEPFVNGIASLLDHLDREQIKNVRIYANDARHLLDALPPASIDRCFVLFADPWPKARHAERRFIGPENIPRLAHVMKSKTELRLATDDAQLGPWMTEHMEASKDFIRMHHAQAPLVDWVQTRYEQKALIAGRQPIYMSYIRA